MPRMAKHLAQDAGSAAPCGGRGAGASLFVEASDVRVKGGKVVREVRVATIYQQHTRDNAFRLNLGNRECALFPRF